MDPIHLVVVFQSQVIPTLRPDGPQHARLPCPSLSPRFSSNSCPVSLWCYLTILSFAHHPSPFALNLSWIKVFSNDLALPIRWPKYWRLTSASVFPMNIQGWFPLGWTHLISLQSKGLSRVFSSTTSNPHLLCVLHRRLILYPLSH